MNQETKKYGTGRIVAVLVILIGWIQIVVAGIATLIVSSSVLGNGWGIGDLLPAIIPQIAFVISGLFLVMLGQLAHAVFDGANALTRISQNQKT